MLKREVRIEMSGWVKREKGRVRRWGMGVGGGVERTGVGGEMTGGMVVGGGGGRVAGTCIIKGWCGGYKIKTS